MFSSDAKEVLLAEGNDRDLLVRAERWVIGAPHRKGCRAILNRSEKDCSCGRTPLLVAFMDARAAGRLP